MGVTGLWTILHPCARPIKLETLNRKRLAVDASIWIYQFLKAVRDKEGNALRNSHVVGFFRRICKLLFFGIKPVFVFDGGAPVLKRQTVSERKQRREGRREDAVRTAGRLLAVQMQRRAEEEEARRKELQRGHRHEEQEEIVPDENLVYPDEVHMTQQERQQNRKFRKKDAYHLPELDVSMNEMGGPNDPRVMSLEELQAYAKQFETGEDINVYDFSKIDFDSPFFVSLPASDRYNILNAARLRSRLRMGHSKEQLDSMFPDRMAFSKFQIERVRERNELTQRLMHLNEGGDALFNGGGRVAGEKGREYVLIKNDGVEGGWALGVISDEGTKQETAIDLDKPVVVSDPDENGWEDEEEFEDVPVEGLNRLPKAGRIIGDQSAKQREAFYKSRKSGQKKRRRSSARQSSLFVSNEEAPGEAEWEDVENADNTELFGEGEGLDGDEDEDLRRALAMSLEAQEPTSAGTGSTNASDSEEDMLDVFQQSAVPEAKSLPKGSGRAIASIVNKRAFNAAPESREITSFGVPAPLPEAESEESEEDAMDLQAALAESRRTKRKPSPQMRQRQPRASPHQDSTTKIAKQAGFSGPLPFEKLDLGVSLLGKKKMQQHSEDAAGGFENPALAVQAERPAEPLPPWFDGNLEEDIKRQKALENEERERARESDRQFEFQSRTETLRRYDTNDVIDLDAEEDNGGSSQQREVIDLEAMSMPRAEDGGTTIIHDPDMRLGDKFVVEPPVGTRPDYQPASPSKVPMNEVTHDLAQGASVPIITEPSLVHSDPELSDEHDTPVRLPDGGADQDEEVLEWSESEDESSGPQPVQMPNGESGGQQTKQAQSRSPSAEFEDVHIPEEPSSPQPSKVVVTTSESAMEDVRDPSSALAQQDASFDSLEQIEFDDFSDPEDEELLHGLAQEAEEHARFASTLNNKSQAQNIADYEKELKQLRNQQKKDRRDADEITQVMIQECQELLRHFGLPYVTAPMEAEAQCAELVRLGLVDGIVTDDSDCFLFGGTRIYKNMFNQAKFVECYLTSDLEKEFDLTREKLIQIAHLLGSDYTEGLPGVGPVTALEILGDFATLEDFKTWWTGVQMNAIPKSDDVGKPFRRKFRKNATKLFLPPTFPDTRVDVAYLNPQVDSDPEQFQWGLPDLISLRAFLMTTIGWSEERTDEVLVPVIRDMNRRADEGTQSNITAFFEGGVGIGAAGASGSKSTVSGDSFAPRKRLHESSKRMGTALSRMAEKAKVRRVHTEDPSEETPRGDSIDQSLDNDTTSIRKRPRKSSPGNESGLSDESAEYNASGRNPRRLKTSKTKKKRVAFAE